LLVRRQQGLGSPDPGIVMLSSTYWNCTSPFPYSMEVVSLVVCEVEDLAGSYRPFALQNVALPAVEQSGSPIIRWSPCRA
jgi:hypothetical protein